ncbi:MAG: hypothetical protein M1836_003850 [Candelina mexicana]|nr:MAG: hypothetical protein M1836_003850 [Candelina mexicana]
MRVQHPPSTAQALLNVFVYASRPNRQGSGRTTKLASEQWRCTSGAPNLRPHHIRRYADFRGTTDHRLRNAEIKAREIQLVQADGTLGPPAATSHILRTFDRNLYHLVQVSPSLPDKPTVCKIISKEELREKERAKAQMARKSAITAKQLELNWAIDPNDLSHRLKKMQEFLSLGRSVDIILAGKRKGRKATSEEAKAVIKTIRAKAMEVEGAKESKPMKGSMLQQVTLFFEGKVTKGEAKL